MYFSIGLAIVLMASWIMYLNELRKRATSDKMFDSFKQVFEDEKLKVEAIINTIIFGVGLILTFMLHRQAAACY
jgi:hypothetical protein